VWVLGTKIVLHKTVGYLGLARRRPAQMGRLLAFREIG
jgi:hypothetical protein